MEKYFYTDGTNNFGPFTIEELKEKGITKETNVWLHVPGEWRKAGTIPELNDLFTLMPPHINKQNNYSQQPDRQDGPTNTIDIFVFLAIAYWFIIHLVNFVIKNVFDNWWKNDFVTYFQAGTSIVFAAIPVVFALSVKNKTLKIIAIVLSALLSVNMLYGNIDWLIHLLKMPKLIQ